ncbi:MAG TPA: MobF family relaxase [Acidimicrobiales bacterium]|nr:MobF family relaxase [Acidimicrobiales bacterium]
MKVYRWHHAEVTVLRLHTVRVGGHGYYVDDLPYGREAGNGLAGESPGRWMGDGAAVLGLSERVEPEAFARVLSGSDPLSGQALSVWRDRVTVAGYDLVFCAPKSVSLLHALGPRELASAVGDGHDAAVQATADYLARAALGVRRRGHGPSRALATTGMVGGAFVHRTSRALDPHLHTHVVAANLAQGVDGVWSAVHGRGLFAHMKAAGRLYQAQLRHELTDRLGVAWDVRPDGLGDVVGVAPGLRGLFSQRSADIKAYVAERSGRASAGGAFYATRPEKDRTASWEALVPEWRHRAGELGYDVGALSRVVGLGHDQNVFDADLLQVAVAERARPDATLSRRDLLSAVATAHVGGAHVSDIEGAVDRLCAEVRPHDGDGSGFPRWPAPAIADAVRARAGELTPQTEQRGVGRGARERPDRSRTVPSRAPRLPGRQRHGPELGMGR